MPTPKATKAADRRRVLEAVRDGEQVPAEPIRPDVCRICEQPFSEERPRRSGDSRGYECGVCFETPIEDDETPRHDDGSPMSPDEIAYWSKREQWGGE